MLTKVQVTQLNYLERMTIKEIRYSVWSGKYSTSCRTCNESHLFGSPEMAEHFVREHAGHNTWVSYLK